MDWYPLWNSLRIAAISSVLVFFCGIAAAYYVATAPRLVKGVLDVVLTLPLVLPPTVCGWLLLLVSGLRHPVGMFLYDIGFPLVMTWYGGVASSAVVAFPLMYRTARGAFESFDETLAWSGQTLGLSNTYIFWRIRMPWLASQAFWPASSWPLPGRWGNTARRACSSAIFPRTRRRYRRRCISCGGRTTSTAPSSGFSSTSRLPPSLVTVSLMERKRRRGLAVIDVQCYKRLGQFCLDVEFQARGVLGLLGPSGSGKSKTLQCIAGIERPDRGRIAVGNRVLFDGAKGVNLPVQERRVGYLFQHYALFPQYDGGRKYRLRRPAARWPE